MAGTARIRVNVRGRVQGVGFRDFVAHRAHEYGLAGYVRNTASRDRVEVLAEGSKSALDALVEALESGPPLAAVSNVEVEWQKATGEFDRFQILL